jgi:hypothetical protein
MSVVALQNIRARRLAAEMLRFQVENGLTFEDMLDAFTLVADENGKKVIVDGLEWPCPVMDKPEQ